MLGLPIICFSLHNRDKLQQHIQTSLSQKQKTFSPLFFHFRNLNKIFCILREKTSFIAQIFWKLLTLKNVVTWMPESSRFRRTFVNQRVQGSETLTNFSWRDFCPNLTLFGNKIQLENICPCHIWNLRTF